ncbi:uncharacterized protein LMH87_008520 [Akanthomyces muscarius]|uniref:Glycosyl transferase CAP10 domain-containing protein n=1 Tax=Akanthomyces muscarius TaxID=2231603 RepID=A0A9W8UPQ9_AKAMU|nr:uncharacterized protein LMH87_008520 [Akanthomyces muscarius]KAJ4157973.1 hypothetical protein LMH87_008520 [Akanthomyces muscarius]
MLPRSPKLGRWIILIVAIVFAAYLLGGFIRNASTVQPWTVKPNRWLKTDAHPIDTLISDARTVFSRLISKQTKTVEEAAQAYRKRRGRHPPPHFDKWFEFAQSNNAVIVEDFFDQVYHDLEPFWGMDASSIRNEASSFEMTINVRNGNATAGSDWFWTRIWLDLVKTVEHLLPDMDLALNAMDEPRIIVPYENITHYMRRASKTVRMPEAKKVLSQYQTLPRPGASNGGADIRSKNWESTTPYWPIVRRGCPPKSTARTTPLQDSFETPPEISSKNAKRHSYQGYVSNYTLSTDVCHQADLQGLEGILIEPLSTSTTKVLFPLFGGSKLAVNNEILLPAPMYWNEEERFTGGDDHGIAWPGKETGVIWRGVASGGRNRETNWKGFQRHRFISMNNATTISSVENSTEQVKTFALPEKQYQVHAQRKGELSGWVKSWANVSFTDLSCYPDAKGPYCNYTNDYFEPLSGISMSQQFNYKYLPDIDGNSFSGRYLGFLRSTSVPIKATLWREWHDSRLVAWKHFIPMDNRFVDYYGIMNYFVGFQGQDAHDSAGEKLASDGKEWAERVLRKEDMQIYVLRLLLEKIKVRYNGSTLLP